VKALRAFFTRTRLKSVALFLLIAAITSCAAIIISGLHDNLHQADVAVVLGNKVEPDGTPSPALKARLDHTLDLYRQGYFPKILVSGAHGKEGYDEPRVMARYLEDNGVPISAIYEDNQGFNTWATAKNTAAFLKRHHLNSVLVISQYFHMPRCRLAFGRFQITPVYSSHAQLWSLRDFFSVPREVAGYISYYFRPSSNPA
jgi:vancomycin permeability regulator SanA